MKAVVLREPGTPVSVEDVSLAPPRAHEVQVRVAAAGVCHSDVRLADGELGDGRFAVLAQSVGVYFSSLRAGHVSGCGIWMGKQCVGSRRSARRYPGAVDLVAIRSEVESSRWSENLGLRKRKSGWLVKELLARSAERRRLMRAGEASKAHLLDLFQGISPE